MKDLKRKIAVLEHGYHREHTELEIENLREFFCKEKDFREYLTDYGYSTEDINKILNNVKGEK